MYERSQVWRISPKGRSQMSVSQSISQWQGHLLSCSGQLQTAHIAILTELLVQLLRSSNLTISLKKKADSQLLIKQNLKEGVKNRVFFFWGVSLLLPVHCDLQIYHCQESRVGLRSISVWMTVDVFPIKEEIGFTAPSQCSGIPAQLCRRLNAHMARQPNQPQPIK